MMKKIEPENCRVAILGSTGSIGTQALDVIRELGCRVVFLSAHGNADLLSLQIKEFEPDAACLTDDTAASVLKERLSGSGSRTQLFSGEDAHTSCISSIDADVIIHAVSGLAGIPSAVAASKTGARLAVANKESVITVGDVIKDNIRESGGELIPVDSEHSAIFQCLQGNASSRIKRILLTASGGPFFGWTQDELKAVTPEQALAHPTWKMGPKITVDCATMMNKGFEIIEAVRLFDVPEEAVEVVVHRQSIIHSMVEYIDNTVVAQLGRPDMRSPIRYAISYPDRIDCADAPLDLFDVGFLSFDRPDTKLFPLLDTAREAIRAGGTAPATLIAADEVAVDAFLRGVLPFDMIPAIVTRTLSSVPAADVCSVDDVESAVDRSKKKAIKILSDLLEK